MNSPTEPPSEKRTLTQHKVSIETLSENALMLRWPEKISRRQHQQILQLQQLINQTFTTLLIDSVVSYHCLIIYYRFEKIATAVLVKAIEQLANNKQAQLPLTSDIAINLPVVKIPVYYDQEQQWDLAAVAEYCQLSVAAVINIHSARQYHGFAQGFTPGFCYLASLSSKIQLPRLATPRVKVPKGAVAIAEQQTAVYPNESPGGWHIIGQTPLAMYRHDQQQFMPTISVGQTVQFYPICKHEYQQMLATELKKQQEQKKIITEETPISHCYHQGGDNSYLEVIALKGAASIQDLGRTQSQHLAFSASGAADEYAYLTANRLLMADNIPPTLDNVHHSAIDNRLKYAALELTLGQITLLAHSDVVVAITGADCAAKLNGQAIKNWHCHQLKYGDELSFSRPISGIHSYLAIAGGISVTPSATSWLGSQAQTINERTLGCSGRQIKPGCKLYYAQVENTQQANKKGSKLTWLSLQQAELFYPQHTLTLRFIPSTLFLSLSASAQKQFLAQCFTIAPQSNRMGYRLNADTGKTPPAAKSLFNTHSSQNKLSTPVAYGAIQLPSDQEVIILMKERQTMGGYPVLGYVMQTDLFRLSQMRSGESINFVTVSLSQAQTQLNAFYQKFSADFFQKI